MNLPNPDSMAATRPKPLHSAVEQLLKFFDDPSQVGKQFAQLAWSIAHDQEHTGPEATVALRKLLESQDAAQRSRR